MKPSLNLLDLSDCKRALIVALLLFCFSNLSMSQSIPEFTMQLTNGSIFTSKDLSKSKPLIIIYFAPDCEHCQALIKDLLKKINEFKKSQIILASFESLQQVSTFEKQYGLTAYPFIKTGVEKPVFFFRYYYHLENTPFTALYDKNEKYVISYTKQTPVDDLIKHLKALK
jgi:thiol-disulfide isomerase/thioredoxin